MGWRRRGGGGGQNEKRRMGERNRGCEENSVRERE